MFDGCSSLKIAPALPATELAYECYFSMFEECESLTIAPELPATILADFCYKMMFYDCTSLKKAPILRAETLTESCYYDMFYHCINLSSVTMLATDVSDFNCLDGWLYDAGTNTTSRTLTLKNSTVYDTIKDLIYNKAWASIPALPDIWKSGASGTTIIYEDN